MTNGGTGPTTPTFSSSTWPRPPTIALINPSPHDATILLDNYYGCQLNSLNDIKVHPSGNIFFTDVTMYVVVQTNKFRTLMDLAIHSTSIPPLGCHLAINSTQERAMFASSQQALISQMRSRFPLTERRHSCWSIFSSCSILISPLLYT